MRRPVDVDEHAVDRFAGNCSIRHDGMASRLRSFIERNGPGDGQMRGDDDLVGVETVLAARNPPAFVPRDRGDAGLLENATSVRGYGCREAGQVHRRIELRLVAESQRRDSLEWQRS